MSQVVERTAAQIPSAGTVMVPERKVASRAEAALLAHLAAQYSAVLTAGTHVEDPWLLLIASPVGQMSSWINPDDLCFFGHVAQRQMVDGTWLHDGHTERESRERLLNLTEWTADPGLTPPLHLNDRWACTVVIANDLDRLPHWDGERVIEAIHEAGGRRLAADVCRRLMLVARLRFDREGLI